eukprot:262512_1
MDKLQNKKRLFVEGYIRLSTSIFSTNTIIPTDIISLCILFISNVSKLFIRVTNKETTLHIFNIHSKTISKLVEYRSYKIQDYTSSNHSYIPNVSEYICVKDNNNIGIDTNKSYDALLCIEEFYTTRIKHKSAALYLFVPDYMPNDKIYYERYVCAAELPTHRVDQILFCGEKHGIIYPYNGYLYQSKLQDINFEIMNWKFSKMNRKKMWEHSTTYLMSYLSTKQKIFAMESKKNLMPKKIENCSKKLKCAVFDFCQDKWMNLKAFEHCDRTQSAFAICDNLYNEDIIYSIGQKGQISQYSLSVNKWCTFGTKHKQDVLNKWCTFGTKHKQDIVCWMDNNYVICCSDGYYFGYMDIRDRSNRWQPIHDIIQLTNQLEGNKNFVGLSTSKRNLFL